jgi:hypothetical protein
MLGISPWLCLGLDRLLGLFVFLGWWFDLSKTPFCKASFRVGRHG